MSILPTTVYGFFLGECQASLIASCITSKFFLGVVPSDRKVNLSSTWSPKKSTMQDNVYCRLMLRCIWHPKKIGNSAPSELQVPL